MHYWAAVTTTDSVRVARFPACPGCWTRARAGEALRERARAALHQWLEARLKQGLVPLPSTHARPRRPVGARWIRVPVAPPLAVRIQLRAARRVAGLSQRALAERLGVSQQQIAALESRDSNMTLSTLVQIAAALDHRVAITLVPTSRGPRGAVS